MKKSQPEMLVSTVLESAKKAQSALDAEGIPPDTRLWLLSTAAYLLLRAHEETDGDEMKTGRFQGLPFLITDERANPVHLLSTRPEEQLKPTKECRVCGKWTWAEDQRRAARAYAPPIHNDDCPRNDRSSCNPDDW